MDRFLYVVLMEFCMIRSEDLLGRFKGTIVEVVKIAEKQDLTKGVGPKRFKGCNERGFLFNRGYVPPIYEVVLENRKKRTRKFRISTDNPPELGTKETYRILREGNGTLYY
jgi:hypothetical protein